jgi:hypothetical protein
MSGNSLEIKLRLTIGNNRMIDRVMTSLIVITFDIGQSAGKKPKSIMVGHGFPSETAR